MESLSRKALEERFSAVSEEIRHYPTPLARCDLHLPALLEERAALMAKLEILDEHGSCSPAAIWTNDGGSNAA